MAFEILQMVKEVSFTADMAKSIVGMVAIVILYCEHAAWNFVKVIRDQLESEFPPKLA